MNKVRVRFGIKGMFLFPNASIFVLRQVNRDDYGKLVNLVGQIQQLLTMYGHQDIANKIVCEES